MRSAQSVNLNNMGKIVNNIALVPVEQETNSRQFRPNPDSLFNASSLAKEYKKDVYGYIRSQKVKDFVLGVSVEYGLDPELEFTDKGNIVRIISGGTAPGTWMHLDIFIKFLGWLDPKLERDFLKNAFAANRKQEDPLQRQLAEMEAGIKTLRKKLSRNPLYKDLLREEKEAAALQKEIDKGQKSWRQNMLKEVKKALDNPNRRIAE
ncbi:KilA-N domain-containing protein [Dysgonomonas termitidis]|uniref:KilA-N domain-containing protein n=1 Tax=Dysgonomonas termitidis TaxID=1516126 RepID=A0ABV9KU24_9BACT